MALPRLVNIERHVKYFMFPYVTFLTTGHIYNENEVDILVRRKHGKPRGVPKYYEIRVEGRLKDGEIKFHAVRPDCEEASQQNEEFPKPEKAVFQAAKMLMETIPSKKKDTPRSRLEDWLGIRSRMQPYLIWRR